MRKMLSEQPWILRQVFSFVACVGVALTLASPVAAQNTPNPNDPPPEFVGQVVDQLIDAIKKDEAARKLDLVRINAIVSQYVLPYVNFEKTTRLAAGKYWRQATPEQQTA